MLTRPGRSGGPELRGYLALPLGRLRYAGRAVVALTGALGAGAAIAACGTQGISVPSSSPYYRGAVLFREHCSGCHTLSVVGAMGSATNVKDRLRNQGPNFNVRKENIENVLYAIRNGGFSGAIMPQNVVVGTEAQQVARFLAAYAGSKSPKVPSVEIPPEESSSAPTEGAHAAAAGAGAAAASAAAARRASAAATARPSTGATAPASARPHAAHAHTAHTHAAK